MKVQTENCAQCESYVEPGRGHCSCGRPTRYASFQERAAYEVSQWRAYQERVAEAATA